MIIRHPAEILVMYITTVFQGFVFHADIMTFKTMNLDREHTIVVKHKTLITVNLSLLHFVLYNRVLTIVLKIDAID